MTTRKRIKQSIAALEAQRALLGNDVVDTAVSALRRQLNALATSELPQRQRKQVTVLFADVSGFTTMAEAVDAEDMSTVMNALWEQLDRAILGHGGRIDKHMGDGVMAIWGAETAREDDPEQAIQAALEMQREVQEWRSAVKQFPLVKIHADIAIRVGIHTGPALLGTVGTMGEYTAIGDTVNTTSRLEEVAPVGGILISHHTYQHVRGLFEVDNLGPTLLKGKTEPIPVYQVTQARPRSFRIDTRGVEGIETRMIGRRAELQHLQEMFHTVVRSKQQQMLTILGEVGVGKSRLLYEFDKFGETLSESFIHFKGRASLATQNIPYALLRDMLVRQFQIQESDRGEIIRHKFEKGVSQVLGNNRASIMRSHFIGQLIGYDFRDSPYLQVVLDDPQQRRDRALAYLYDYLKGLCQYYSVVLLLEDVHWADDSSLDMIEQLSLTMPEHPMLIICLARPSLFDRRPFCEEDHAYCTRLTLAPLSDDDSRRLVLEILQKVKDVPESLLDLIVSKTDGNPFYIEELIKKLIEDGIIMKGEPYWQVVAEKLVDVHIPPTLAGILQTRMDSLAPAQQLVLLQASVVGHVFWDSLLAELDNVPVETHMVGLEDWPEDLQQTLSVLCQREFILWREGSTFAATQEYVFKHTMQRDVIYESVLKQVRNVYHLRVADWLIEQDAQAGLLTGLIADHLEKAGEVERAITYLRKAGEQAAAQLANVEALLYFNRALALIPESENNGRHHGTNRHYDNGRYYLLSNREKILHLQGRREDQLLDLQALAALAESLNDARKRAEVALREAEYALVTGDYLTTITAAKTAIRLTPAVQDTFTGAAGYLLWGRALRYQGDYEAARIQQEQALTLARTAQSAAGPTRPLRQVEANTLQALGLLALEQGDLEKAGSHCQAALQLFRGIADQRGEGQILNHLGDICRQKDDPTAAREYYEQSLHISQEIGNRQGEALVLDNLGTVSRLQGDYSGARIFSRTYAAHQSRNR